MDKSIIKLSSPTLETVNNVIEQGNEIYKMYSKIIDSYVLDFFTCSHWNRLPSSWRLFFKAISPKDLAYILDYDEKLLCSKIPPLSLLCLKNLMIYLSIPRLHQRSMTHDATSNFKQIKLKDWCEIDKYKVMKLFWKNVKMKKQHELSEFAEYTYQMALKSNCNIVVDVGAGLGHLCRLLCYGYNLRVVGIEAQDELVLQARKLNEGFERLASKYAPNFKDKHPHTPHNLKLTIKEDMCPQELSKLLQSILNISSADLSFGIVGLHPCGDLGPILLNMYKNCPNVRFVNVVGCCYMKLSSGLSLSSPHFSPVNINSRFELSYHAREIACHAIEAYMEKLQSEKYWELKVHSYRATLEKILNDKYPQFRYKALASVKYTEDMTFAEYCEKALKKLPLRLSHDDVYSDEILECLSQWRHVMTFYTVRLMFAPIIETLIILDRYLHILPVGHSFIDTIFDPNVSPRNFVVTGLKK
ncbi:methyltransferase-like protein 25B [Onthophagus taurus]|uniref:methyltransferase-like protein 25B n=1 Tax=Onthophagus taurus TaxID=166361 RepID=UPI0039BE2EBB